MVSFGDFVHWESQFVTRRDLDILPLHTALLFPKIISLDIINYKSNSFIFHYFVIFSYYLSFFLFT